MWLRKLTKCGCKLTISVENSVNYSTNKSMLGVANEGMLQITVQCTIFFFFGKWLFLELSVSSEELRLLFCLCVWIACLVFADCDVNCHKKCEKLMPHLCGVNQKLIVEALSSLRKGRDQAAYVTLFAVYYAFEWHFLSRSIVFTELYCLPVVNTSYLALYISLIYLRLLWKENLSRIYNCTLFDLIN